MLPIENDPELLKEYGRTIAWINVVENNLNLVILVKGNLLKANCKLINQVLDDMMFGKKIRLASNFLDKDINEKLWKLNDKRVFLAYGVTGAKVPINNPRGGIGELIITFKQNEEKLSNFLENTVENCQKIYQELNEIILQNRKTI